MNENNKCLECGKKDLKLTKKGQKENLILEYSCSNCRDIGYIRNNANIGMYTKYKNFKDNNKSSKKKGRSKISLPSAGVGGGSAEVGGGGYAEVGGGYDEEEYEYPPIEERNYKKVLRQNIKYDIGFVLMFHGGQKGLIDPSELTKNVDFTTDCMPGKCGFKPQESYLKEIIENAKGDLQSVNIARIGAREYEIEMHKKKDSAQIFEFKSIIHPHEIQHPRGMISIIPRIFSDTLLNDGIEFMKDRKTESHKQLKLYSAEIKSKIFHRILIPDFDEFFIDIERLFKNVTKKSIDEQGAQTVYDNFLKSFAEILKDFSNYYNEYNQNYVIERLNGERHKIMVGNEGPLPVYDFGGMQRVGENPNAGISVIVYEDTTLHTLLLEYIKQTGNNKLGYKDFKTIDGAILRRGSLMFGFFSWLAQYLDLSSQQKYTELLEKMYIDYSAFEGYKNIKEIGSTEILQFNLLLKQIIGRDSRANFFIFSCCLFDPSNKEKLKEQSNEVVYDSTQSDFASVAGGGGGVFGGGGKRRKTRRNKKPLRKTRRSRKTR